LSGRPSGFAVGLAIVPALVAQAALALSPVPLVSVRLPAGALALAAAALALSALFLAPLAGPSKSRSGIAAETAAVAFLAAGALAAAALLSGSPAPLAETAGAAAIVTNAFFLGRVAASRGEGAVRAHFALAFSAVFAAPFAGYLVADFGAPGAADRVSFLRNLNPLRALPPWGDGAPSWLALALPASLALSTTCSFLGRRRSAAAGTGAAAMALAVAFGAAPRASAESGEVDFVVAAPVHPGEWVPVRASGPAWISIGGGARVAPKPDRAVTLVPVGPAGAAALSRGRSFDAPPETTLPGPGDAAADEVRVGIVAAEGEPIPSASHPVRVVRVLRDALSALGPDGLSGLDAIVSMGGPERRLSEPERGALALFVRRGGVVAVPLGDALSAIDPGLGLVVAVPPSPQRSAVDAAVDAAVGLGGSLEPRAVEKDLATISAVWRTAAERGPLRFFATLSWVSALVLVLFLSTRAARGAGLLAVAIGLSAAMAGSAAWYVALGKGGAIGADARVVFARARGGPARIENWLAVSASGRSSERLTFETEARLLPREVLPFPVAAGGVSIGSDGTLGVDLAPDAVRVFVGQSDGDFGGAVELTDEGTSLANRTGTDLLDVRLLRGGAVVGGIDLLPAGSERSFAPSASASESAAANPFAANRNGAFARFLVGRVTREGGRERAYVVARRTTAGREAMGADPAARISADASEWLVLRAD
jgi:hypothetical protein